MSHICAICFMDHRKGNIFTAVRSNSRCGSVVCQDNFTNCLLSHDPEMFLSGCHIGADICVHVCSRLKKRILHFQTLNEPHMKRVSYSFFHGSPCWTCSICMFCNENVHAHKKQNTKKDWAMICTICFLVVLSDYQNKMYQVKKRKKNKHELE